MIAPVLLALALFAGPDTCTADEPVTVSPAEVEILDLAPGMRVSREITATNTCPIQAQISVTGAVTTNRPVDEDDLLVVDLAGCPQPWAGLPERPTCAAGEIPASSGGLPAVPLEAGDHLYLLITAGLGANAGDGAQGQTWTADLTVTTSTITPTEEPALASTGTDVLRWARISAALVLLGVLFRVVQHTRKKANR